jgi:hypothetical protein
MKPKAILTTRSQAVKSRVANTQLAQKAGQARKLFESYLLKKKKGTEEVIGSIRFGSRSADITNTGRVNPPEVEVETDKGIKFVKVPRAQVSIAEENGLVGSAPLNKVVNGFEVPCGVCLIIAGGGAGKTPLAWGLAAAGRDDNEPFAVCRIGEPLAGYVSDDGDAASLIIESMLMSSDVVVDSIKDLLSSAKGAAMKSGLSRDALSVLSSWSELACAMGSTLYVPVNPSTPDQEVLDMLAEAARSNATCTIISSGKDSWEYFSRTGEGLNRRNGKFGVRYDAEGWATVSAPGASSVRSNGKFATNMTPVDVTPSVWNDSMRRSIEVAIAGK